MNDPTYTNRRTVLKTIGAGVVGSVAFVGTASAGDWSDERRQDSFTWGRNELWEMLESEPHPPDKDSEGNEPAHRPLWVIDSMAGTGVPGSEHSPHPAPIPGIDHVVPLDGPEFTAQWHVKAVVDPGQPFLDTDGDGEPDLPNFVNQADGTFLTSADRIRTAEDDGDIQVIDSPTVFTCPVRPHIHK
jgi:hypothetical protein